MCHAKENVSRQEKWPILIYYTYSYNVLLDIIRIVTIPPPHPFLCVLTIVISQFIIIFFFCKMLKLPLLNCLTMTRTFLFYFFWQIALPTWVGNSWGCVSEPHHRITCKRMSSLRENVIYWVFWVWTSQGHESQNPRPPS